MLNRASCSIKARWLSSRRPLCAWYVQHLCKRVVPRIQRLHDFIILAEQRHMPGRQNPAYPHGLLPGLVERFPLSTRAS
jgi:hypothetical protein